MTGFMGKILKVDLTGHMTTVEPVGESVFRKWLGGYGLGAYIVYRDMQGKTDPLGPDNVLGFTTGILTGTLTPFSGSCTVVGKSPLTGTWGDSRMGGSFGPQLKAAGYDAVFCYGRSMGPVYLWITDNDVQLHTASDLWGRSVSETEVELKTRHGSPRVQVASIGPAGEKCSLIAGIITDKGRAAGRSGLGAVMGSKRLKAIAVHGSQSIPSVQTEQLTTLRRSALDALRANPAFARMQKYGTSGGMAAAVRTGDAPVKNWGGIGERDFPTADKISDDNVIKYDVGSYGCLGCPVACGGIQRIASGPYAVEGHKPEYETLAAFGSMCLNDHVESIIYLNHLCNEFGFDTISVGSTIAFAMECYENGLLTKEDTEGIALDWGDHAAIVEMTVKMARREGFGDVLADGVQVAAHKIGKDAHRYAMHVHGQELPMHDPKFIISSFHERRARMYLADATPGRHTQNPHDGYALQATGICSFIGWLGTEDTMPTLSEFLSAVTGWTLRQEDLYLIGNRIATMRQAFNAREGLTPRDFTLPDRVLGNPPFTSGPLAGIMLSPQTQVQDYFKIMGWDYRTGKPRNNTLRELELLDLMLES